MEHYLAERSLRALRQDLPEWAYNLSFDRNPLAAVRPTRLRRVRGYHRAIVRKVEDGRGLWLAGASGSGKTAAAALLVQEARRRGVGAVFANVPQLLTRLQRTRWDDDLDLQEEELHERLAGVPLLALDDLSAMRETPYAAEQLYLIVNRRYNRAARNATIVTSDLSRGQLEAMFGERLIRRVAQLAGRPVWLDRDDGDEDEEFADIRWRHSDDGESEAED